MKPSRMVLFFAATAMSGNMAMARDDVSIIMPGAPGQPGQKISSSDATKLADSRYSPADVQFMQGMIMHHQQAVDMAALVKDRTNHPAVTTAAARISASQLDEMKFMRDWLTERSEPLEMAGMGHAHHDMKGMASPAQMAALAAASGVAFDSLFLSLMVAHHDGALKMVDELLKYSGTAYDPVMAQFVDDVKREQKNEIERMNVELAGLSSDPRATLKAGFADAGEAISNLRKVASLPRPAGFFDPANPADLQPVKAKKKDAIKDVADPHSGHAGHQAEAPAAEKADPEAKPEKPEFTERFPLLSFANTDIAFSGDVMVTGNYHGWNAYRLGKDGMPQLVSSVVCPGGQGDVSISGNLLIMSVQDARARTDCGLQGVQGKVSTDRFRGLRIFDISDIARPVQVGQVQTCRGSHTHSVVKQTKDSLIIYNSGTSRIRDKDEMPSCIGDVPGDDRTALFRIDVIEVPLNDPSQSRIVDSPAVFADPKSGRLAGLWQGGDHGDDTQETNRTDHCHDITVFPTKNIAAGACSGNGVIFDISDPRKPKRIDEVTDKGFAYWHSATFSNDGSKVLFTDEWGGGGRARCLASDPKNWGANAIYEIVDKKLQFRSLYKLPAPQSDKENCVAHNGSIIPVPGRDIFVQAWYQGGISVIDFTDAKNPKEIAYFDRGPIDKDQLVTGGYWSAYWYKGRIYATEIVRGVDVFALSPSAFLTAEEIAAAEAADQGGVFNPQTQFPVTWPNAKGMKPKSVSK